MSQSTFSVNRYTNRNGATSWRVDGRLNGLRIRRNFKSQEEAAAERSTLEIRALQIAKGLHSVATELTPERVRDAELAFRCIGERPHSLLFYVEYALAHYREPTTQRLLSDAVADYVALKEHERDQDLLSEAQLVRIKRDLERVQKRFPKAAVADLTASKLLEYFESGRAGFKTFNNRRGIVSTFLKFCLQREWIAENPLARIPAKRIRRRRSGAATLTAARAKELMEFVETEIPVAVPFFALCLFAGIRPCLRGGEILRLKPSHVRLKEGIIRLDGEVSKVREPRTITIQPNLAAWLRAYPLEKFTIVPANLQHLREKAVGKFNLSHDVMRHTFISMFAAKFRSLGEAALQAGNSEAIIRKHYLDLKGSAEADAFFSILPQRADESITDRAIASSPITAEKAVDVQRAA